MHQLIKRGSLFVVKASLPFKNQNKIYKLPLVWDTGAVITLIDTKVTDYLGYSAREDSFQKSALDGAAGRSEGYLIHLPQFSCLGFEFTDFVVGCHDMDTKLGVLGLLGMNFFKHFRIDMDYGSGEIYNIKK